TCAGGCALWRMPPIPLPNVAAKARYGFASAPGSRHSTRNPVCSPTVRNPHVRLSRLHTMAVGAQDPSWYRLYELTKGAYIHAISRAVVISPPKYQRKVSLMWGGVSPPHMSDSEPSTSHTLECR